VLAAGLNVVWGVGLAWTVAVFSTMTERSENFVQLLLTPNGTPVLGHRYWDGRAPEYTTLDGKPFPATESGPWLSGANLSIASPQAGWSVTKPVAPVVEGFTDGLPSPTDWFFLQFRKPHSVGYFVGYDRVSQQRVGYLGRAGFQIQEPAADQAFLLGRVSDPDSGSSGLIAPRGTTQGATPAQYSMFSTEVFSSEPPLGKIPPAVLYLVGGGRTFRIDLRARAVAGVLATPGLDHIATFSMTRKIKPAADAKPILDEAIAVRGPAMVTVLDASGREETVFHLPNELSDRTFNFFQMPDRSALALVYREDRRNRMTYQDLIWFTKDGTITRRIDGALASKAWRMSLESLSLIVAFAVPMPVGPIGTALAWPLTPDYETLAPTYYDAVFEEIPAVAPAFLIAAVWTGLAIWLYYRRVAWLAVIGLLGLSGYFGYVLRKRWPAQLACPSCGELAPRDRDHCALCGRLFPSPEPNGREIFA
jgi:hypothetical protein